MDTRLINHCTTWLRGYNRHMDAIETIWKKCGREQFIFSLFDDDAFPGISINSLTRKLKNEGHIVKCGYMQSSDNRYVWSLSSNAIQHCIAKLGPVDLELEERARENMETAKKMILKTTRDKSRKAKEKKRDETFKSMLSNFVLPIYQEVGSASWTFSDVSHIVGTPARLWVMHKFDLITNTGEKRYITRKNHGKVWKLSDSAIEAICQQ
jgi:hypothetical protein